MEAFFAPLAELAGENAGSRSVRVIEQLEAVGGRGGFTAASDAKLGEDPGHVNAGGLHADDQLTGDLAVGSPFGDEPQNLRLPGEAHPLGGVG
jgi:hypothetical protein